MYPFLRLTKEIIKFRNAPPLGMWDVHVSHHRIWPWDLDFMSELNNGRTLSIFDLGRIPFAMRSGLFKVLRKRKWGLTVAGSIVRYRRRLTNLERIEMQSRLLGWDERFMYIEQSMWTKDGTCANHGIFRTALVGNRKMVPTADVVAELGRTAEPRHLPDWVAALFAADDSRPWPPEKV
ncbi:thioeseterase [Primorskyibacter flagellatus]|uniref:Thioeseterase n=1 Tax=Primorskyibacter flagellatus TaxID=1387277 RepID=A0A917AAK5_9RHOB|nr:acyl-CoA thioesterase [Primorskyibacter flagellatus]GGE36942.1 thioeseterase [Primorskyibacter flagellatus]